MSQTLEIIDTEESKILPYNIQAEQRLLGSILVNNEHLNKVSEFLRPEHFYEPVNQKIFSSINLIIDKGISATPVSLHNMFAHDEQFKAIGGDEYLAKLAILATTIVNPYDYGKIIYDLSLRRDLIAISQDVITTAYDSGLDFPAVDQIEAAENKLFHLASEGVSEKGFLKIQDTIAASITSIDRAMKSTDHITGITTGLMDLDGKLSGFHNSDLLILAGRPSMGKTAFAVNLAINACRALQQRHKGDKKEMPSVGLFSLEMSSEQLSTRILSMYTHIDSSSLRSGRVNEQHYNELRNQANILSELPFFIDDTPALSISAIRTRARRLKRKHNLGILFIDYLQLIRGSGNSNDNRVQEISEITQGLKALAKELNIPIIALSQLSRAVEQRDDKRPMLSDLRESGSIEQDADIVMFIYREEYYLARRQPPVGTEKHAEWLETLNKVHNQAEIIIAKHRNGPVGTVQLFYDNRYSQFKDYIMAGN
ncbi:MAG UNVERIFIED_CONTAM: replicative DNA helicase [Planctomycetaceae bacterium]|jgi:replicative DNA helicase